MPDLPPILGLLLILLIVVPLTITVAAGLVITLLAVIDALREPR